MSLKTRWRALERSQPGRIALLGLGALCLIAAPIIGVLPGPGGFPLAIIGATLLLRYARWTKRLYVRLKRRWPRHGHIADRSLRRASAKRRAAIARARAD